MSQWSPVKPGLQTQVRVRGSGLQELSTVPAALHSQSADREHKHKLFIYLLLQTKGGQEDRKLGQNYSLRS